MKIQVLDVHGSAITLDLGMRDLRGTIGLMEIMPGGVGGILHDKLTRNNHCFDGDGRYIQSIQVMFDSLTDSAEAKTVKSGEVA
jgi:hypothetical protein